MSGSLTGYSFPEANGLKISNRDIDEYLFSISPIITMTSINTHAINLKTFNSIVGALTNSTNTNRSFGEEEIDNCLKSIDESLEVKGSNDSLPRSINLFFNTITHNSEDRIKFVITSSPQIKVDLTKGWKTNQSIFNFLKEMIGNSPFTSLFGEFGEKLSNKFSSVATFAQTAMQMTGRDIQLGPYWSFSNSPLSNYPEFSMETVLINDSDTHYERNKEIVELLTLKYLPTTENNSDFKFKPPYLFNIEIGVNYGFIKKMYFCKATFNVTETGKYFISPDGEKIPEFFKVSCHFTSLLPDIKNLSLGFSYDDNSSDIEYIEQAKTQDIETKNETPLDTMIDNYEKEQKAGNVPAIALPAEAVRARVGQPVQHYDPRTGFNQANPRDTSHMKVGPWRSW